jgi:hypothetical protein
MAEQHRQRLCVAFTELNLKPAGIKVNKSTGEVWLGNSGAAPLTPDAIHKRARRARAFELLYARIRSAPSEEDSTVIAAVGSELSGLDKQFYGPPQPPPPAPNRKQAATAAAAAAAAKAAGAMAQFVQRSTRTPATPGAGAGAASTGIGTGGVRANPAAGASQQ